MINRSRSFHLCVTYVHTNEGVADAFIADLQDVAAALMAEPDKKCTSGMVPRVKLPIAQLSRDIVSHARSCCKYATCPFFQRNGTFGWQVIVRQQPRATAPSYPVPTSSPFYQYRNRKIPHGIFFSFMRNASWLPTNLNELVRIVVQGWALSTEWRAPSPTGPLSTPLPGHTWMSSTNASPMTRNLRPL
jgi:hypothetical protein